MMAPFVFAVTCIAVPAGLGVCSIVSSLLRIGQPELVHRRQPIT